MLLVLCLIRYIMKINLTVKGLPFWRAIDDPTKFAWRCQVSALYLFNELQESSAFLSFTGQSPGRSSASGLGRADEQGAARVGTAADRETGCPAGSQAPHGANNGRPPARSSRLRKFCWPCC